MNAPPSPEMITPARSGWLAACVNQMFHKLLDRIDTGLAVGRIEVFLPDGSFLLNSGWRVITSLSMPTTSKTSSIWRFPSDDLRT